MGPNSKGLGRSRFQQHFDFIFLFFSICLCIFLSVSRHSVCATNSTKFSNNSTTKNNSSSVTTTHVLLENIYPSSFNSVIRNASGNGNGDSVDPEELLRKALINHTLTYGGEEDLDKLIFSNLPEGSKLVLQTVKIIPTDQDGNPIGKSEKEVPVHWDVSLTNATTDNKDEESEEDDSSEEEYENENAKNAKNIRNRTSAKPENKVDSDLVSQGSHAQANYKAYGDSEKQKEKHQKHYHGTDHGKTKKITHTDTDGVKDTKYTGQESGLTDSEKDHGKAESNEGERYRNTKKKNKGRRVSGFKRVYHKEEFQRTEHFYDDEDAKKIAESYGLKDAKEKSSHGLDDDDRKYHGTRKEYTDGNKVKNELGTSQGYKKGQLTEYKDSEKHKHRSHYNKAQHSPNYNQNYQQQNHHPSHNYHGSYSNPKNTIRRPNPNYSLSNQKKHHLNSKNIIVTELAKAPMTASFVVTEYQPLDSSTDSSSSDVQKASHIPKNVRKKFKSLSNDDDTLEKPDEMKMFFSPRDHRFSAADENAPIINNNNFRSHNRGGQRLFAPKHHRNSFIRPLNNNHLSSFHNKIGNISDSVRNNNYTSYYRNGGNGTTYDRERYANDFPSSTVRNTLFGQSPKGYSTIVKIMPVKYINLTDDSRNSSRQQSQNSYKVASPGGRETHRNINDITFTTVSPLIIRRPPPTRRGKWISISIGSGDPDMSKEFGSHHRSEKNPHPNHNYHNNGYNIGLRPIANLVRGVKNKLMNPIIRPRFPKPTIYHISGGNRFDVSKFPPNVIVKPHSGDVSHDNSQLQQVGNNNANLVTLNDKNHPQYHRTPKNNIQSQLDTSYPQISSNQHQNSNKVTIPFSSVNGHRSRTPHTLPPFMNNLMDSVANFFTNVG